METERSLRPLRHAARVVRGVSGARWMALVRAAVWVPATRVALVVFPWRKVSAVFDRVEVRPTEADMQQARDVVWAVDAVARRVLPKRPCLTQALVARHLLRRRGVESSLQIGAARDDDGTFRAHAWLEWGGEVVIGGGASPDAYAAFRPVQSPSSVDAPAR